ncbi:MAG: hypothetical protein DWQ07_05530 [Chloroflexi bacterium]|nr:MAG: hypothetical protein DWQ07_05530 [Chloroflexota bacterium]MBL1194892.1 hypothetical protein [Chloroflexota bacterium]NOH12183.1 hypothetical protein [Chloroflexota bacterium]
MKPQGRWLAAGIFLLVALACRIPLGTSTPQLPIATAVPIKASATASATLAPPSATPSPSATITPTPWDTPAGPTPNTPVPTAMPQLFSDDSVNFLLIGSDSRGSDSFRTDVLIIVNVQPEHQLVTMISVPRDLYVYIPGWTMQRVNAAYQHGEASTYPGTGFQLLGDTIEYNLGIKIDHTALVDFAGFQQIINTMGGIDVPTACEFTDWRIKSPDLDPEDEDNWELHTIGPGVEHLDGELALWYVRSRLRSSDFDRGRRQQEVLRAIFQRAVQLDMLTRIPQLFQDFQDTVDTDVGLDDILSLAPLTKDLSAAQIRSYYINNDIIEGWRTPKGASVLLPNADQLYGLLEEALSPPDEDEEEHLETVVEVWNGTNNANWDVLAAERLSYGGYGSFISLPDNRDHTQTLLYDFTDGQDVTAANNLLFLLGLSGDHLVSEPAEGAASDYRIVLGDDYNPCFNPAQIPR